MAQAHPEEKPEDDLTAVLGRFRAWNLKSPDTLADEAQEAVHAALQEVSYEEALDAHRSRRRGAKPDQLNNGDRRVEQPPFHTRAGTKPALLQRAAKPKADTGSLQQVAGKKSAPRAKPAINRQEASNLKRSLDADKPAPTRTRPRKASSQQTGKGSGLPRLLPAQAGPTNTQDPDRRGAVATFESILKQSLRSVLTRPEEKQHANAGRSRETADAQDQLIKGPGRQPARAKQLTGKSRRSSSEKSPTRTPQDEAGASLSAYMRQCTIDVQVLRGLLAQTITDLHGVPTMRIQRPTPPPIRPVVPAGIAPLREGFVTRLKGLLFGRVDFNRSL